MDRLLRVTAYSRRLEACEGRRSAEGEGLHQARSRWVFLAHKERDHCEELQAFLGERGIDVSRREGGSRFPHLHSTDGKTNALFDVLNSAQPGLGQMRSLSAGTTSLRRTIAVAPVGQTETQSPHP